MTGNRTAVVAGSTGVIGNRLARGLAAEGWKVIGLTRRSRSPEAGIVYLPVDLDDLPTSGTHLAAAAGATHLFYAARSDALRAGEQEPIAANAGMLANAVSALCECAPGLSHVHLVQGTKYYGSNVGPFRTPAKECDPRGPVDNFYFAQEDFLLDASRKKGWNWSISRPAGILDPSPEEPRSIVRVIGAWAAIQRELGQPLHFPGSPANFHCLYQFTDARLLSQAVRWIATAPGCANQAFNVTNGDFFRWENLWPRIAAHFEMPVGSMQSLSLAEFMADKAPVWSEVVRKHGLRQSGVDQVALWAYGDYVFGTDYDVMSDTTRLRRSGFQPCLDTEETILELLRLLSRQKILP